VVVPAHSTWEEASACEWRVLLRKKLMGGAAVPVRGFNFVSSIGNSDGKLSNRGIERSASTNVDDDISLSSTDSSCGGVCDVNELNTAFVRFNGLYSVLFSADLHLLQALFRAMVASPNRHSITLSLVRIIEHAGQTDAVIRAAAASEVQSCSDAALLFRRRSLAFNLMKALLQVSR
jgi:hypothetical protein